MSASDTPREPPSAADAGSISPGRVGSHEAQPRLRRKTFEKRLRPLHVELVKLQRWVQHRGDRAFGRSWGFAATDAEFAPWYVVAADDARQARWLCRAGLASTRLVMTSRAEAA